MRCASARVVMRVNSHPVRIDDRLPGRDVNDVNDNDDDDDDDDGSDGGGSRVWISSFVRRFGAAAADKRPASPFSHSVT